MVVCRPVRPWILVRCPLQQIASLALFNEARDLDDELSTYNQRQKTLETGQFLEREGKHITYNWRSNTKYMKY